MDAPLRLVRHDDREIVLAYRANRNWMLVAFAGLMVSLALAGHGQGKLGVRIGVFAIGSLFVCLALGGALWRDSLTLGLGDRRYQRASGFLWRIRTQTGPFDEIDEVTLSRGLRGGGRGGTYTFWSLGLRFRQPLAAAHVDGFKTEADARKLVQLLARALHVPFIDRTVKPSKRIDWNDIGRPFGAKPSNGTAWQTSPATQFPEAPSAGKIELTHFGVRPVITVQSTGLRADAALVVAFSSAFVWLGYRTLQGMVGAIRTGGEHYWLGWVIGASLFLMGLSGVLHGVSLTLAQEYVQDDGDALTLGKQILGVAYQKSTVAKDAVMDVVISQTESAEGFAAGVHDSMRERLSSLGSWQTSVAILTKEGRREFGVTLSTAEQQWLVEAVRAMCESRA